jgi:small subunit ribosomal protein S17
MTKPQQPIKRKFKGTVVSNKMDKTVVVRVERAKKHPKYLKIYKVSKNYKVHDPENKFKVGDKVEFVECRPMSKDKRWRVVYQ